MRPGMGGDLVPFIIHALHHLSMLNIDLALVYVVTGHEECGLRIVALEQVQNVVGEGSLWAVVVCECNGARGDTSKNAVTTIRKGPNLVARY